MTMRIAEAMSLDIAPDNQVGPPRLAREARSIARETFPHLRRRLVRVHMLPQVNSLSYVRQRRRLFGVEHIAAALRRDPARLSHTIPRTIDSHLDREAAHTTATL